MSNIKEGTAFENDFCRTLSEHGFWVHRFAQNSAGQQPADVIAVRDGFAYLIDCKVCQNDRFALSRIEANQQMAMDKWLETGNTRPQFALRDSHGAVWMLEYGMATILRDAGHSSVQCGGPYTKPFEAWTGTIV